MTKSAGPCLVWFKDHRGHPSAAKYRELYYGMNGKRPENVLAEHSLTAVEAELSLDALIQRYPAPEIKEAP
jgi:hypothetical protein